MINRDKLKKMYVEGYNASQIAKAIGSTKAAVQKYIQRNFNDIKEEHKRAVVVRREAVKALNHENNRYISDRSFILKNRSAYMTMKNGDIVLNKKVVPIVSYDTPKLLKNENNEYNFV